MKRLSPDGKVKTVRQDHIERYLWASRKLSGRVIDAGCNSGYGAATLADAGLTVLAIDTFTDGLYFAEEHYDRPSIEWLEGNLETASFPAVDGVVAFEVIEHLARPEAFLTAARKVSPILLASVPNEDVWPWHPRLAHAHHRHYRRAEFASLLSLCGWTPAAWWSQFDGYSPVEPEGNGRTLVVECT